MKVEIDKMDFCGELCIFADQLIEKAKPKWIPVCERLPEIHKDVLVCDARENYVSVWQYCGEELWYGEDIIWATEDITHWMPTPKPPKEDEA